MNRRDAVLVSFALGATGLPTRSVAQAAKGAKPFRIAMVPELGRGQENLLKAFVDMLRGAGRLEGRDFTIVGMPPSADIDLPIKRLVEEGPDLIFAANTRYVMAARRATRSIPIVMWEGGFPVEAGYADSLAKPGQNVTGVSQYAGTRLFGKYLQLLQEAKPSIKRIGVLWPHVSPAFAREEIELCYADFREAAGRLGVEVRILETATPEKVDAALDIVVAERIDGLMMKFGFPTGNRIRKVMEFVLQRRIPILTDFRLPPTFEPLPLLTYGPRATELIQQAATYVERILWGGAKPGDLPIQQPTRFELTVSLSTAKALGITIPQSVLLRADEVIQ